MEYCFFLFTLSNRGIAIAFAPLKSRVFRALCRDCNEREKAAGAGRYVCHRCNAMIDDGQHIKFRGDSFHPYHFKCKRCLSVLSLLFLFFNTYIHESSNKFDQKKLSYYHRNGKTTTFRVDGLKIIARSL